MTTVTLLKRYSLVGGPAFNIGECIGVDDALAASLIVSGIARAVETPPVHRMVVTAPTAHPPEPSRRGRPYVK